MAAPLRLQLAALALASGAHGAESSGSSEPPPAAEAAGAAGCQCPGHYDRTYCPLDKTPGQCDKPMPHAPCKPGGTCPASAAPAPVSCYLRGGTQTSGCAAGSTFDTWLLDRKAGTFTEHQGLNCYLDHGSTWSPGMLTGKTYTLASCEAACKNNTQCDAVTVGAGKTVVPAPPPCPGGIAFNPAEQIPGPSNASNVSAWRTTMHQWKSCVRKGMNYTGAAFDVPALEWTQRSYIQPQ